MPRQRPQAVQLLWQSLLLAVLSAAVRHRLSRQGMPQQLLLRRQAELSLLPASSTGAGRRLLPRQGLRLVLAERPPRCLTHPLLGELTREGGADLQLRCSKVKRSNTAPVSAGLTWQDLTPP